MYVDMLLSLFCLGKQQSSPSNKRGKGGVKLLRSHEGIILHMHRQPSLHANTNLDERSNSTWPLVDPKIVLTVA